MKKTIAVLFGGCSSEHEISRLSAATVLRNLSREAYEPVAVGITKEGVAEATSDMNAIYKDGIAVAAELKGAFDDIRGAFDFGSFLKK